MLATDVAANEDAFAVDVINTVFRDAIRAADRGLWDKRITLPDGRRLTVRKIVKAYGLERWVEKPEVIP